MHRDELLTCRCTDSSHQLVFHIDVDPEGEWQPEMSVTAFLRPLGFWQRIVAAFRYVFLVPSKVGHFHDFLVREEDAARLRRLLDGFIHERRMFENAREFARERELIRTERDSAGPNEPASS